MNTLRRTTLALWLLTLASPFAAFAQGQAGISGTVSDPQRAAVAGATITLVNPVTERTVAAATTDGAGRYTVAAPAPGTYQIVVEAPGFERAVADIVSQDARTVTHDVELAIAAEVQIVRVTGSGFVARTTNETPTQTTVGRSTLALLGTAAQSNIYRSLSLMPSVNVETSDPYGLSSRQPWNLRVRGQAGIGTGLMVEGIPVWAVESPGPRADMWDLENIDRMTLFRGAIPADQGLGAQDTAGALDIRLLEPAARPGITVTQGLGSWGFHRTFVRLDSGELRTGTRLFGSYSRTGADKWKGEGAAPRYRDHVAFGIEQPVSPRVAAGLYVDVNRQDQNGFRGLSYAQVQDLDTFAGLDFNPALTGVPATDASYYGFNFQTTRDVNVAGRVSIALAGRTALTMRPYYWTEDQTASGASAIPAANVQGVRRRNNDFDRYGNVAEVQGSVLGARVSLGYWFESFNLRLAERYYTVNTDGTLSFDRWALNEPSGRGTIHSPYVAVARDLGRLRIDAGLRYFHLDNPGQIAYETTGLGDMSFDDALAAGRPVDAAASFVGNTQAPWLPYAGANYQLAPGVTAYGSYGRSYARSHGHPELMQTFLGARAAYTAAGVDMQYLYDQFDLATANNYELGVRLNRGALYLVPSVFRTDYRNKLLSVFDPVTSRAIRQAVGRATVSGFELEAGGSPTASLALVGGLSYNRSRLLDDLQTASNAVIATAGKQTPDAPEVMLKGGVTYSVGALAVSPIVRFVGARYGDASNSQRIPSYTLADLTVSYAFQSLAGLQPLRGANGLTLTVSAQNLFDRQYVAVIGAFEDAQSGNYFAGAPRTVSVRLGVALGK